MPKVPKVSQDQKELRTLGLQRGQCGASTLGAGTVRRSAERQQDVEGLQEFVALNSTCYDIVFRIRRVTILCLELAG